jgi:hypothetical protein
LRLPLARSAISKLAPGMSADAPYDAIKVNLPNGMSAATTRSRALSVNT